MYRAAEGDDVSTVRVIKPRASHGLGADGGDITDGDFLIRLL
jgi:hypothetical protein